VDPEPFRLAWLPRPRESIGARADSRFRGPRVALVGLPPGLTLFRAERRLESESDAIFARVRSNPDSPGIGGIMVPVRYGRGRSQRVDA
jgi:hypothetical protein